MDKIANFLKQMEEAQMPCVILFVDADDCINMQANIPINDTKEIIATAAYSIHEADSAKLN
jgi:hypothetical protein